MNATTDSTPARSARPTEGNLSLLKRVYQEAQPHRRRIVAIFAVSLLGTPLALLSPVALKIAVDSVIGTEPLPSFVSLVVPASLESSSFRLLIVAAALQVVVVLLMQVQGQGLYLLQLYTGERLTLGFRARLLEHAQRLSFSFHDGRGTADSIYRIQNDAPAVQWIAVYSVIRFVSSLITLVTMLFVILRINWQLGVVALTVSPFLFLSARGFSVRMRSRYRETKQIETSALKVVQEVLTSFRVVKAFGREDAETERFVDQSRAGMRARLGLAISESAFRVLINLVTASGTALVLFIGIQNVQSGALTLGGLLIVLSYLGQLYGPLSSISQQAVSLQNHLAGAQRAFELIDEIPSVKERPHARRIRRAQGRLDVKHVSFSYGGGDPVLHDVSFEARRGARIGIAGPTGAGKTTLVSLITRFYDPSAGRIALDGIDLRQYKLADLRRQFGVVLQEPVLFSTSIADNIAYARPSAGFEEVKAAAEAAEAHDFVMQLPDGYGTVVGERGMRLSGGERQRISLARAFLKDAPILILDEPTSSVDVGTESAIMVALERLIKGRTTLMIAHRKSTLEGCDTLIEIEAGRSRIVSSSDPAQPGTRTKAAAHDDAR